MTKREHAGWQNPRPDLIDKLRGVSIRFSCTRLQVITPYNDEWRVQAKELHGSWKRSGFWSISSYHYNAVVNELNRIYGTRFPNHYNKGAQSAATNDREEV